MRYPSWALAAVILVPSFTLCGQQTYQSSLDAPEPMTPGHEIGSGAGDIGRGAGYGTGHIVKGVGKGALDTVRLHPVVGLEDLGQNTATGGKEIATGAVKGTGKMVRGTVRGIRKIF